MPAACSGKICSTWGRIRARSFALRSAIKIVKAESRETPRACTKLNINNDNLNNTLFRVFRTTIIMRARRRLVSVQVPASWRKRSPRSPELTNTRIFSPRRTVDSRRAIGSSEKIRKPAAVILEVFHTSRAWFDDDVAMIRLRVDGKADIARPFNFSHPFPARTHVIRRSGRELRTRPYGLRDAGKLIGILMVLLRGGDLRVQDEARKLAARARARARARTGGREKAAALGVSEREKLEEARPRV